MNISEYKNYLTEAIAVEANFTNTCRTLGATMASYWMTLNARTH